MGTTTSNENRFSDDKAASEKMSAASDIYEADAVIVGAGAAGLMAAYFLCRNGRKVIVLEKGVSAAVSNFARCGGPAACETRLQEETGAEVTLERMYRHMYEYSRGSVNEKLLRSVLACTGTAVNAMLDLGIGMSLMEDTYGVGFRGRHFFEASGLNRTRPIVSAVEKNGGVFLYKTEGKEVVLSETGCVAGLRVLRRTGEEIFIRTRSVLVCTGGFLGSSEMQMEHFNTKVFPLGNTLSDGSGIRMVQAAGGTMDRNFAVAGNECGAVSAATAGWPFTAAWKNRNEHYGYWLFGGLFVDRNGERFIDEGEIARYPLAVGGEALTRVGKAYAIMDSCYYNACYTEGIRSYLGFPEEWTSGESAEYYNPTPGNQAMHLEKAIAEGWACRADTMDELVDYFGLVHLNATVEKYNQYCTYGADGEFGKDACFLKPVTIPPFYAFEYVPSGWCTLGGLKTDSHLRAVKADNEPIPGLYAAGNDIGSMYSVPYYDNEGASVGLALGSGVLAAREMSEYLKK